MGGEVRITTIMVVLCLVQLLPPVGHAATPEREEVACGVRAVSMAMQLQTGRSSDADALAAAFGDSSLSGEHSFGELKTAIHRLGFVAHYVKYDPSNPAISNNPVIVALDRDGKKASHFVVFFGRDASGIQLLDFPRAPQIVPVASLPEFWNGEGLEVKGVIAERGSSTVDIPVVFQLVLMLGAVGCAALGVANYKFSRKRTGL